MNLHDWYKRVDLASKQAATPRSPAPSSVDPAKDSASREETASAPVSLKTAAAQTADQSAKSTNKKSKKGTLRRVAGDDEHAVNAETREQLLSRLLDPILSLDEAAKVLNVCPTTVRRYTNSGALAHLRTQGNQRRFLLSDVLAFLKSQQAGLSGSRASRMNAISRQVRGYAGEAAHGAADLERSS